MSHFFDNTEQSTAALSASASMATLQLAASKRQVLFHHATSQGPWRLCELHTAAIAVRARVQSASFAEHF